MRDEANDRPAWGKRDPLSLSEAHMDDNYAAAQRRYDRQEPEDFPTLGDPLESTLAQRLADWVHAGGRERLIAMVDLCIDEFGLGNIDAVKVLPTDPSGFETFTRWVEGGTGPRDETRIWNDDFDARR